MYIRRIHPDCADLFNKFKAELPGILRWAVRGCIDWIQNRETMPDVPEVFAMKSADYQESMDSSGLFIAECCIVADRARDNIQKLYPGYNDWYKKQTASLFKTQIQS